MVLMVLKNIGENIDRIFVYNICILCKMHELKKHFVFTYLLIKLYSYLGFSPIIIIITEILFVSQK